MNLYPAVKIFAKTYYKLMFKFEVKGLENIPTSGNGVLCCNHTSNFDPLTIAAVVERLPRFIAKKELFSNKLIAKFLFHLKAFPVDREATMDMKAFKTAINVLKEGELLAIFAEGTRIKNGESASAKSGVSMFALKGNAPVIPIAISSTYKFRSKVTICFGEPITLEEYRGQRINTQLLDEITTKIMAKVDEMKV